MDSSFSKSPLKPYLLMKKINDEGYNKYFDVVDNFNPINKEDFLLAHTNEYVDDMYNGKGNYLSNGLPYSKELIHSLPYTTGSLLAAKEWAINYPEDLCFAPVSGMHHAQPNNGCGFCTFSGQVISAVKIYEKYNMSGAYLDLDGHYGNSIDDTYKFQPLLEKAIPKGCNINPRGRNGKYILDFEKHLGLLQQQIIDNKVHYVVFAHGADSHEDDDLGGHLEIGRAHV